MENIENADNLTIETIYKMVLEMKSKLDFIESETHAPQSDKAGLYMESIDLRLSNVNSDIVEIKADIESMKLKLSKAEADILNIKADVESMKLRLSKVEADIVDMKTDIAVIKADTESMKLRLIRIETDIADIKAEQSKFYKWGLALAASIIVSVSSIVSLVVIFAN